MLIVFEGVDASGKQTQCEAYYNYLKEKGLDVLRISFPDYESPSSSLVKMYLGGEFGENANDISPYAASSFYAVDRYASYKTKWGKYLSDGKIILADRYVTSNMIHQAAKLENIEEKDAFLQWVYDFEYEKMGLPKPDAVLFLDMPPHFAMELMAKRANKITNEAEKDIHEKDRDHIVKAYNNAKYVADKFGFKTIKCADYKVRSIKDITDDIIKVLGI